MHIIEKTGSISYHSKNGLVIQDCPVEPSQAPARKKTVESHDNPKKSP
jgi:hypothetical protein